MRLKSALISYGLAACLALAAAPLGVARSQAQQPSPQKTPPTAQPPQPAQPPKFEPVKTDGRELEELEEKAEAIANELLELSVAVRDYDARRTADFFTEPALVTPLPAAPAPATPKVKWVREHSWKFEPKVTRQTTRAELAKQWDAFLANFSEIEDVRFKLKASDDIGDTGRGTVAFYVIGRNNQGQREWARGSANALFVFDAAQQKWKVSEFAVTSLTSLTAAVDLFSEVSDAAGVAASLPAYGESGNAGFVWRGAVAEDFNRDGWLDLFVTAADRNFLYLNDGRGKFRDASEETGVKSLASGAGPVAFDFDGDGDADIFIANVGGQILFENRLRQGARLEFRDVSLESGVGLAQAFGFSAAVADVNSDGRPDVYVASYNQYGRVVPNSWWRATNGTPNLLFINQGGGTFREEAKKWGVDDARWSYAAAFADVNGDHQPDLYVANDFGEKAMFINRGDRFVDEARERGVLDPGNGMGVAFGDYNNDGLLDLHATNMSSTAGNRILARLFPQSSAGDNVLKKLAAGNNLYENLGVGKYKDVTAEVGGFSGGWAWGGGFIDFDNDGWEDLFTPNGFISGKSMKDT
jgi:hypothetical protein